ncbi:paramyosin-like [Lepisosteus oculatus]|uniref:paramyosin-like n=1 Tax=Lepisosteus oculatus TaxID=7918 RepID=UPI0035F50D8C
MSKNNKQLRESRGLEVELIKNLQQKVYFLELEATFLREKARKAAELEPQITSEAEHMLRSLQELQSQSDGLHIELMRKEGNINILQTDREKISAEIQAIDDGHLKDKQALIKEIVQLKRLKEHADRQVSQKEMEILKTRQEIEQQLTKLKNSEFRVTLLEHELQQREDQHKTVEMHLSEKRVELQKVHSAVHEMEEKHFSNTVTMQDHITKELRDEICFLHQEQRERDLRAERNRLLRQKMSADCETLAKENSELRSRLAELSRQLDKERALMGESVSRHSHSLVQLLSVKDSEKQLQHQLKQQKEILDGEKVKHKEIMDKILLLEQGRTSAELSGATVSSRRAEMEALLAKEERENVNLRRDKALLVDLISSLQQKLIAKDSELAQISSRIEIYHKDISTLKSLQLSEEKTALNRHQPVRKMTDSLVQY